MPINLQNPEGVASLWGPEPKLDAPNIGGLVEAILKNRQFQQASTQKSIADTIKELQTQRQGAAYGSALQNAGIVPQGVDVSGVSGPDLSKLAELYQGTIPDTDEDKAKQALANYHNAAAQSLWTYPGGKGTAGVDYSEHAVGDIYDDQNTGIRLIMTSHGPKPVAGWGQPTSVKTQTENQQMAEQVKLMQRQTELDALQRAEEQANRTANKPGVPFSAADEYNRNKTRLQQLQQPRPSYATPDQIKMARARQALDDPQATPEEKAQAQKILSGE